jgi:hypothetical protein
MAPDVAAPAYVLVTRQSDGSLERIDHAPIVAAIPGDASYSPFRVVFALVVTDAYRGELVTSADAIEEAVTDGLIESPVVQGEAVDWPIVASDIRLEVGGGQARAASGTMYYRHQTVTYFDLGAIPTYDTVRIPIAARYELRRDGHEPLSEPVRQTDLDGDGDTLDTNDILERASSDPLYSPVCRTVRVVVPETIGSIDTTQSDATADLMAASQLFTPAPVAGTVLAYEVTDEIRHCAPQRTVGGL